MFLIHCLHQVGSNLANAVDDGQWSQGLISAVSCLDSNFPLIDVKNEVKMNCKSNKTMCDLLLAAGSYGGSSHQ